MPVLNVHHVHFVHTAFVLHIHRRKSGKWGVAIPVCSSPGGYRSLWHPPRYKLITGGTFLWPTTVWH